MLELRRLYCFESTFTGSTHWLPVHPPTLTAMVLVCCCGGGGGGGLIKLAALFVFIYTFFTPFDFSLFSMLLLLFSVLSFLPFFFSFSLPFSGQLLEATLDRLTEHCICLQCSRRSGRITAAAATRAIVGGGRWWRQRKRKRKWMCVCVCVCSDVDGHGASEWAIRAAAAAVRSKQKDRQSIGH